MGAPEDGRPQLSTRLRLLLVRLMVMRERRLGAVDRLREAERIALAAHAGLPAHGRDAVLRLAQGLGTSSVGPCGKQNLSETIGAMRFHGAASAEQSLRWQSGEAAKTGGGGSGRPAIESRRRKITGQEGKEGGKEG